MTACFLETRFISTKAWLKSSNGKCSKISAAKITSKLLSGKGILTTEATKSGFRSSRTSKVLTSMPCLFLKHI